MQESVKLKYLFVAEFLDGTILEQTPNDVSKLDPQRSEYYDVLQAGKTPKKFSLVGNGNKVSVDLQTGLFEVNGVEVLLEADKLPTLPDEFRLIFYRQWTHNQNVTFDQKTGEVIKREDLPEFCEYFIGWQCTIKGKNYTQKLAIS